MKKSEGEESKNHSKKIIIVAGPTASGKTSFSIKLAQNLNSAIINADSLQIYSEIPILSAQPTLAEQNNIPHHLFGYVKGDEEYSVARWIDDARANINKINSPILVGGTGFYLKHLIFGISPVPEVPNQIRMDARNLLDEIGVENFYQLLQKIDPLMAEKIDPNNSPRILRAYEVMQATGKSINYWHQQNVSYYPVDNFMLIILQPDRDLLYQNCNKRFLDMLEIGAIDEVKQLLKQNYPPLSSIMKAHGVPELARYLANEYSLEEASIAAQQVVRNYAKRQTTWFKHQFINPNLKTYFVNNPEKEFEDILRLSNEFLAKP